MPADVERPIQQSNAGAQNQTAGVQPSMRLHVFAEVIARRQKMNPQLVQLAAYGFMNQVQRVARVETAREWAEATTGLRDAADQQALR